MTAYSPGDVVLVEFVFSDESGVKKRPALVVSAPAYQKNRQEIIVAAITSNTSSLRFGDVMIQDWKKAGLLLPSVSTAILRTIKQMMIFQRLGTLIPSDFNAVKDKLNKVFDI